MKLLKRFGKGLKYERERPPSQVSRLRADGTVASANNGTIPIVRRFVRFCVVGGSGVFVDMGVLFLLADPLMLGWNIIPAKICATEVAIINNFVWNDLWTFRGLGVGGTGIKARSARFAKFNLICGTGTLIATTVLYLLVRTLGRNLYRANLIAIIGATVWNFGMNCAFNWRGWRRQTVPDRCIGIG